jgi:hypothetical protein
MTPSLRRALVWSPLLFTVLVGAEACGARSFLTSDTRASAGTGGGGGAGGVTTATVSSSTGFDTTTATVSASVTSASSTSATTSSSSGTGGTGGTGGTTNPIVSDSPGSFLQSETSVVAGPNGVVAVAWIDLDMTGVSTIGYVFSTDDGATFNQPTQIQSPGNRVASDPVLAIDATGNIYVTWVAFHTDMQGNPNSMRIYVSRADAGSTTFGMPIRVSAQGDTALYDKPWITVTNGGELILTYERDAMSTDFSVIAARSGDGGMTWQRTAIADDPTGMIFRNLAFPCAPKDGGHLWVTYLAQTSLGLDVRLARSDDGGVTWSAETIVSQAGDDVSFDDPSCVAENDEVWVSYGLTHDVTDPKATKADKSYAIQLAHSADAGQTIDARLEAEDQAAGSFFQHAQITREDSGAIDLVYYAGQMDEDPAGSYRRARIVSGEPGNVFGPSVTVEAPVTFLQARDDQRWLGDYTGLFWRGGELYTSYVTNASGTAHIAFAKAATP